MTGILHVSQNGSVAQTSQFSADQVIYKYYTSHVLL